MPMARLAPFAFVATAVSPVGNVSGDAVSYLLGFGPLGVGVVLFGLGYIVPRTAVASARADLIAENQRLVAERDHAAAQRDEALKFAQENLVPLLVQFTAATASLLPILQDLTRQRDTEAQAPRRRDGR
jgi:hypothetical protein